MLLLKEPGSSSWFDSRFPIILPYVLLSRRLHSGHTVRLVSADLPQAMGLCGVVERVAGWSGRLAFVEVHVVLCLSPEFDRKLLLLAEPYHLSKSLFEQYKGLCRRFGPQDDFHPGWGELFVIVAKSFGL